MGLCQCIQNFNAVITPNISELCPGEYPTTTDILIINSTDDTTVQNINDVMWCIFKC